MLIEQDIQSILIAFTLFSACWPIYRSVNKRYWILITPYVFSSSSLFVQYGTDFQNLVDAMPIPIVQFLFPLPFHLGAICVKRFNLEV